MSSLISFAVHQPNFLPWLGYFVKMVSCDVFVYLDDVQMPMGRSYVSRVAIRKGEENQWLTVPVTRRSDDLISAVRIVDSEWRSKHLLTLRAQYEDAPGYPKLIELIEALYGEKHESLAELNVALIDAICAELNIAKKRVRSSAFGIPQKSDERIARIGSQLGAGTYVSGTGGNNYQSEQVYRAHGIALEICKTAGARAEALLAPDAQLDRSIIDVICAKGFAATADIIHTLADRAQT